MDAEESASVRLKSVGEEREKVKKRTLVRLVRALKGERERKGEKTPLTESKS